MASGKILRQLVKAGVVGDATARRQIVVDVAFSDHACGYRGACERACRPSRIADSMSPATSAPARVSAPMLGSP